HPAARHPRRGRGERPSLCGGGGRRRACGAGGSNPLLGLFSGGGAVAFAAVAGVAVANGVLVQIVMLARLFYGMAHTGQIPRVLAWVHPTTQTPVVATVLAGAVILIAALLLSFERLLLLTDAITLAVFAMVDLSLWRVKRRTRGDEARIGVPMWLPPLAAAISIALMVAELAF